MTKTMEVQTSVGKWVLKRPKAGIRNRALKAAESDTGHFKKTILMEELLPRCVQQRPDGFDNSVPISQQLDDLEMEDYDLLFTSLSELMATSSDMAIFSEQSAEEKKNSLTTSQSEDNSLKTENTEQ